MELFALFVIVVIIGIVISKFAKDNIDINDYETSKVTKKRKVTTDFKTKTSVAKIDKEKWLTQFDPANSKSIEKSFQTTVVGVTYPNDDGSSRQKIIKNCMDDEELILIREPNNPKDPNAVMVCRLSGQQLGYLDRGLAREVSDAFVRKKARVDASLHKVIGDEIKSAVVMIHKYKVKNKPAPTKRVIPDAKPYDESIKAKRDKFDRGEQAHELEMEGYIENAIELYESMIKKPYFAPFPYNRLAIIYRARKDYDNEIRVIDLLLEMFRDKPSGGPLNKIEKNEKRRKKAVELREKANSNN